MRRSNLFTDECSVRVEIRAHDRNDSCRIRRWREEIRVGEQIPFILFRQREEFFRRYSGQGGCYLLCRLAYGCSLFKGDARERQPIIGRKQSADDSEETLGGIEAVGPRMHCPVISCDA